MTIEEYLNVPYIMHIDSYQRPDGTWSRRAAYPELDCVAESESIIEAISRLEEMRVTAIISRVTRNDPVPVPRSPLKYLIRPLAEPVP
jgi:hypothetical protein